MVESQQEQHENQHCVVGVKKASELRELIYKDQPLPQDRRFLDTKENGGVFKYFLIKNIIDRHSSKRVYPYVELDGEIVGLAELEQDPNLDKNIWVKFVSIDPKYQGKGYGSQLMNEIFKYVKEEGYSLQPSRYSDDGLVKLKPLFEKLSKEYGVTIIDE